MTRGAVLAAALFVSAAALGWHWWPERDTAPQRPPGTPFFIIDPDAEGPFLEPHADRAAEAVPAAPVPLPAPVDPDTAFGLAADAFPEPVPLPPPEPPRPPPRRAIARPVLSETQARCRRLRAQAVLGDAVALAEMVRLDPACRG